jgi:hypothetical protein
MEKVLLALGLLVMIGNVLYGFRLKRAIPGGVMGERGNQMLFLIVFFALAYLGVLLLTWQEPSSLPFSSSPSSSSWERFLSTWS